MAPIAKNLLVSLIRPIFYKQRLSSLFACLTLGLALGWASGGFAQVSTSPSASPPAELAETLAQIDAAASKGDLRQVMRFYSPSFTSSDGLTHNTMRTMLDELWKRYPGLTYQTKLESWEQQGDGLSTVTTTTITGEYPDGRRNLTLSATITARQHFQDGQIVEQEILSERSELTSGDKPPTVTVHLPDQVTTGEQFDFDAVVSEPLGERLLLGAALEESINVNNYLNPAPIELELLSSGGLFKVGQAPNSPGNQWVSAIIVRDDGITAVTQRLHIVDQK